MEDATQPELVELTAKIVSAYVSNNSVVASDIPHLISETHAALSRASGGVIAVEREEQKPKVPVKKSVMPTISSAWRTEEVQVAEAAPAYPLRPVPGRVP